MALRRTLLGPALVLAILVGPLNDVAAAPDPTIASLMSLGCTLIPVGITSGLLLTGPGKDEGIRFDLSLTFLSIGSVAGPSVGQVYGEGGTDAVVTFFLRAVTAGVMVVGTGLALRGTDPGARDAGTALAVIGAIPTAFLAGYDIFGAASSARAARIQEGHAPVSSAGAGFDLAGMLRCPGPIPCL